MRTSRTARHARVAEPPDETATTTPASRSEHSAKSTSRVLDAEQHIRVQIAEMLRRSALDVGNAAVLDPGIESRGASWHAEDDQEHEDYLAAIDRQIADAQERVTAAGGIHRTAEEHLERARQDYREARRRLGADPLTPPSTPAPSSFQGGRTRRVGYYSDPRLVVGGIRLDLVVTWTFVAGAVGADIAAFYSILALLFRTDLLLIGIGTGGFAAAAVGIAHLIGIGLKRRKSADSRGSNGLLWSSLLS